MKAVVYILSLVSCFLLTSCFTVIETTTDDSDYYVDNSVNTTIIIHEEVHYGGGNNPRPNFPPVIKPNLPSVIKDKGRKSTRPSNGTKLRDTGGQRSSNKNENVNRDNDRDKKNVKKISKSQRR